MKSKRWMFILGIIVGISLHTYCTATRTFREDIATNKDYNLTKIVDTINIINALWVGDKELTADEYYEAALDGIVHKLDDPYSEYLNKENMKSLNEGISGKYVGVGIQIQKKKGEYIEVVSPFVGGPGFKAGIQPNDKIISINGESVIDMTSLEASKKLKGDGEIGSKVTVEVLSEGDKEPKTVVITREEITLEVLSYKMIDKTIGYISLQEFDEGVSEKFKEALISLKKEGMKELIIDLRTNPGGILQEAVKIGSMLTPKEDTFMVSLNYKNGTKQVYDRNEEQLFAGAMVVLINGGSASASEILTGILKDYGVATIIGEKSYGKGVAQQVIPFGDGDGIKLTIAKYHTPKNDHIHKQGIEPDIFVKQEPLLSIKGYENEVPEVKKNRMEKVKEILVKEYGEEKANEIINQGDVQLKTAINHLKGVK